MIEQEPMLLVAEIAGLLRVSKWTVYRLIDAGELEALRVGRGRNSIRVPESAYRSYVADCRASPEPERLLVLDPASAT